MSTLDQVISASEAAKMFTPIVTIQHIRRLCRTEKITARQTDDGTWMILKSSVTDYLNSLH